MTTSNETLQIVGLHFPEVDPASIDYSDGKSIKYDVASGPRITLLSGTLLRIVTEATKDIAEDITAVVEMREVKNG